MNILTFISMLSQIFMWLLKTSIYASLLILVIIFMKTLFKNKLSSKWHYSIWTLLIIELVNPFSIKTNLGIHNLLQAQKTYIENTVQQTLDKDFNVRAITNKQNSEQVKNSAAKNVAINPSKVYIQKPSSTPYIAHKAEKNYRLEDIASIIWMIGSSIFMCMFLLINIIFYKKMKNNLTLVNKETRQVLQCCKNRMGVKGNLGVFKTHYVKSPILYGTIHPNIIIPHDLEEKLNLNDLKYIFLHELSHLKRRDIPVNYLVMLLQIIYWFNPVILYGFYRMKKDREIVCDAMALSFTEGNENKEYGCTIIKIIEEYSRNPQLIMSAGLLERASDIKDRIVKIKNYQTAKNKLSPFGISIILLIALLITTGPQSSLANSISESFNGIKPTDEVVLTINKNIQKISENALRSAIIKHNAKGGTIIAMETKTGKILSFVNLNQNNLNKNYVYSKVYKDNLLFKDVNNNDGIEKLYDQGSLMKPIVAAAALNESAIGLKDKFTCKGYVTVEERKINCWLYSQTHRTHGTQSLANAFNTSCNSAFIQVGQRLGWNQFNTYANNFGFIQKTGIDIPGEANGIIQEQKNAIALSRALLYIGTGAKSTNIQTLNAINCIANQGKLIRPYIINKVIRNGKIVNETKPTILRQVISQDTSRKIIKLMEGNVIEGSAMMAKNNQISIAAQTSTTLKIKNNVYTDASYASICGFAPADNPKISVIILIDEPDQKAPSARTVATPVLKSVIINSMKYMN